MEWWKPERASTSPSSSVTVMQTLTPASRFLSMRLATEPWM